MNIRFIKYSHSSCRSNFSRYFWRDILVTCEKFRSQFRARFGKPSRITIVSGLPRSGTSLMMNMLGQAGIPLLVDNERKADEDNPKGYFEYERVKNLPYGDSKWLEDASGKAVKVIAPLLIYLPIIYLYQIIIMRRDYNEIIASQRNMMSNRGKITDTNEDAELLRIYKSHFDNMMNWIDSQNNIHFLEVNFNELFIKPGFQVSRVIRFLGKKMSVDQMTAAIDPALYRQRASNL